jgi:hypothetical protein
MRFSFSAEVRTRMKWDGASDLVEDSAISSGEHDHQLGAPSDL